MIDLDILTCLFVDAVYKYNLKIRAGVKCRRDLLLAEAWKSYNYLMLATNYTNGICKLSPSVYGDIIVHQNNTNSLTIETCC